MTMYTRGSTRNVEGVLHYNWDIFTTSIAGNSFRSITPSMSSDVDVGFACGRRRTIGRLSPVV